MKVKSPTASAANTATSTSTDGTVLAVPLTAAPVEAVTVYGRNALIRRVIRLESLGSTPAGTTLLRLRGVSGQLIADSLRVSAASPGLTILDVNARSFYATGRELDYLYNLALDGTSSADGDDSDSDSDADEAVDPKTLPLRKQVAIAEKHVGKLKAQVDRMSEERSLFKAFMNKACHADASGGSLAGAVGSFTAGSGVSSERAISSIQDMLATYRSKAAQYDDEYEALRSKCSAVVIVWCFVAANTAAILEAGDSTEASLCSTGVWSCCSCTTRVWLWQHSSSSTSSTSSASSTGHSCCPNGCKEKLRIG
ncbi:hypothetical protein GQ42DRAFT_156749 [Ramicandelaber brevisporus]|nr:hypothetical protein GQ42DRAFT_156749 [Ramicandelaber brevisporus]